MAQLNTLQDDTDGTLGMNGVVVKTHIVRLDDREVEVDLTEANFQVVEEALALIFKYGRPVKSEQAPKATMRATPKLSRPSKPVSPPASGNGGNGRSNGGSKKINPADINNGLVREWARAQGIEVNARGRVPGILKDQYLAAVSSNGDAPTEAPAEAPTFSDRELLDLARQTDGVNDTFAEAVGQNIATARRVFKAAQKRMATIAT